MRDGTETRVMIGAESMACSFTKCLQCVGVGFWLKVAVWLVELGGWGWDCDRRPAFGGVSKGNGGEGE